MWHYLQTIHLIVMITSSWRLRPIGFYTVAHSSTCSDGDDGKDDGDAEPGLSLAKVMGQAMCPALG